MSFDKVKLTPQGQAPVKFRSRTVETPEPELPPETPQENTMMLEVPRKLLVGTLAAVVVAGLVSGYAVARFSVTATPTQVETASTAAEVEDRIQAGAVFGSTDQETFKDDAEGVLIMGGLDGEGSHTLLRPGGISQNVYLTSSVVDLDQFDGMRVRVWGETFKGQKAGWLMDVGRLEVKQLDAEKPAWYTESNN